MPVGGGRYRIWHGLSNSSNDGFERGTSVWKGHISPQAMAKIQSVDIQYLFESLPAQPQASTPARLPPPRVSRPASASQFKLNPDLPGNIRDLLEEWFLLNDYKTPPCLTNISEGTLFKNASGTKATWWHKSGIPVTPTIYEIANEAPSGNLNPRLLTVEGKGLPPMIVKYSGGNSAHAIGYRVWVGVRGGNSRGFAHEVAVYKSLKGAPTTDQIAAWLNAPWKMKPSHLSAGMRKGYSSVPNGQHIISNASKSTNASGVGPGKSLRPRDSISAPEKFQPTRPAETKRSNHPKYSVQLGKRKRDEANEDDAESLLSSFLSPAAEKIPAASQVKSDQLSEHMNNNTVLLFYPETIGSPRVRTLGTCDSVQKLFAQALAGDVFGNGGGAGSRVVSLTFGGGQQKTRSLVEDDDQDYDDLVAALKELNCWFVEDGALQGSVTIEVRAK